MTKLSKSIFDPLRSVQPAQMRMVAERRFADAFFLVNDGNNARANAAMYLGGFAIECLLKARLLEKTNSAVKYGVEDKVTNRLNRLIFQSHDLKNMLLELPEVEQQLQKQDDERGTDLLVQLKKICALWTIYARYSTQLANRAEARRFLESIREVKRCL